MSAPGRTTLRTGADLAAARLTAADDIAEMDRIGARYTIAVPPALAGLIDRTAVATDPIARQVVPDPRELETGTDEQADPIGDGAHEVTPGLIHRYPDRVLLKLVSACAVYCRFCFRREEVGRGGNMSRADLDRALGYIRDHPDIWEVILSGGDPLTASTGRLGDLVAAVAAIPHVRIVRIHTRMPVAAPERITPSLAAALRAAGVATWLAVHTNHARELTPAAREALDRLAAAGCHLVSQTVLLRGVNDDVETLAALMRALVEAGVKPYYLHHPDLAPGTGHFRVSIDEGRRLVTALRGSVSGLCQPVYVLDVPGGHGKVPIGPDAVVPGADPPAVRDATGRVHASPAWRRSR